MAGTPGTAGMRSFLLIWAGQVVSLLGSAVTAFAVGIWVFEQTNSVTRFTLMTFCAAAPPLLVLPFAGPLIDRWSRKRLLISCEVAGAAATGTIGALVYLEALTMPLACLAVAVSSGANALQWPTHAATVTSLVHRDQLGRASGMTQLALASSNVLGPLLAGALIVSVGLAAIAVIDLITFAFSTTLIALAWIPPAARAGEKRGYWADVPFGIRWISGHAGLAALLAMFIAVSFFTEVAAVLFTPLLLRLSTPAVLGTTVAVASLGMIGGGAVMAVWGGPRRPVLGAAAFAALSGVAVASAGLASSIPWIAAAATLYFFCEPMMLGSSQVAWQRCVPAEAQGRVFATRAALAGAVMPLASLVAGPLADRVVAPALAGAGPFARMLQSIAGTGAGREISLVFVLAGALSVASVALALLYAPLRRLDDATAAPSAWTPATATAESQTP